MPRGSLERAADFLEACLAVLLFVIVAAVVTLVVMRYAFNSGVIGSDEAVRAMFVYTTAIGAAVAAGRGDHVAITFCIDFLPARARRFVDALIFALVALLNLVMFWHALGWIAKSGDYLMPALQLPQSIKQICIPIGCGAAVLFCAARAWLALRAAVARPPERAQAA